MEDNKSKSAPVVEANLLLLLCSTFFRWITFYRVYRNCFGSYQKWCDRSEILIPWLEVPCSNRLPSKQIRIGTSHRLFEQRCQKLNAENCGYKQSQSGRQFLESIFVNYHERWSRRLLFRTIRVLLPWSGTGQIWDISSQIESIAILLPSYWVEKSYKKYGKQQQRNSELDVKRRRKRE